MEKAEQTISSILNAELGEMPSTTNRIIMFLNSKNRYDMDDLGVDDRTETKNNLVVQLMEKCHTLEVEVNMIFTRIDALNKKGLPSLFLINDKLMTREDYKKKLQAISKDTTKYSHIKGVMIGRAFYEAICNIIFIQHEIHHIFVVKPTFAWYTEVYEIYHKGKKIVIPNEEWWDKLCEFKD